MQKIVFFNFEKRSTANVYAPAPELSGAEPGLGVAREEIDIDSVVAPLSAELGASRTGKLIRRALQQRQRLWNGPYSATLALAEAYKYQEELDASSLFFALKCPISCVIVDGLVPSACK